MADDLRSTWDDIAFHWDDWGPPLRPSADDLRLTQNALATWHQETRVPKPRVFLCGVTPEIATLEWPFPIDLNAMDHAESMVRRVWPGDVPGVRRARVGKWEASGLAPRSQDVVIGDGGFGFFEYPAGQRALAAALHALLAPGGLFIYRHFAQIEVPETLESVLDAARRDEIGNFHVFKWRLAMALQPNSRTGVRVHDVWQAWMDSRINANSLRQPGWSLEAVRTIDFYRDKDGKLYFPTLDEFREVLAEFFGDVTIQFPTYELGERCPSLSARRRH